MIPARIAVILPRREGIGPQAFGAVSLCVRDFTLHSRYRDDICILNGRSEPAFDSIRHIPAIARKRPFERMSHAYARACNTVLENLQPALIEIHNRPGLVKYFHRANPARIALHLHNDPQQMRELRFAWQRQRMLARCDAIYCVSEYICKRLLGGVPSHRERAQVIYNGLALPASLPGKEKTILFVGRLTENKGGLEFAQALALALPQLPGWRGVIVGGRRHSVSVRFSAYEQQVYDIASRHDAVDYVGFSDHEATMREFSRAAIAVVPSLWEEPFGRTALEAMAAGCAVISSGRGGLREVTGEAALNIKHVTPSTIAEAIVALAQDEMRRNALQKTARTQAARFAVADCTKRLDEARDALIVH